MRSAASARERASVFSASAFERATMASASALALARASPASALAPAMISSGLGPRAGDDGLGRGSCVPCAGGDLLRLGSCVGDALVRFLARARRDLFHRLPRLLEEGLGLLANPLERVFDRRLRRPTHFELGDQAIDLIDVSIDSPALVAAGCTREGDVADRRGHAHRNLAEAAPLFRRRRRLAPLLALLGVLLIATTRI
jgi:hypothetical protein